MNLFYIYKIKNTINNLSYIGFTCNPKRRFQQHKNKRYKSKISYAIQKYGIENFLFEVIYVSKDREHTLNSMEPYFIEYYQTYINGYNLTMGGECLSGDQNYMHGKTHSEEVRKKISDKTKGRISPRKNCKLSEESKNKISTKNKGKKPRLGAKLSLETKEKIRKKHLGKKYSNEVNQKKGLKGKLHPNYNKKHSDETRQNISNGQKARTDNQITLDGVLYRSKRHATSELKISFKSLNLLLLKEKLD